MVLAATIAAAAVLRFWTLGRQGFWYDEATTGWVLRLNPFEVLGVLPRRETVPPLYYAIAWPWSRVFGRTEIGLRSLSALAGVATVPVAFLAARALAGRRVALVAAALVAVNPLLIWYSQEARCYALLVLVAGISFWLFLRARSHPTRGRLTAWAIASALAVCTHYFAAFVVVPEALWLLSDRRASLRWRLSSVALVGIAGIGLLPIVWQQRNHAGWIASVSLKVRATQIPAQFLVGFTPPATLVAKIVAGAAVLTALALLVLRGSRAERRGAAISACIGACAIGLPLLLAVAGLDRLDGRNVLAGLVPLALAVAIGLGIRRARPAGFVATAALVGVSVAMYGAMLGDAGAQRPNWRPVVHALRSVHGRHAILMRGSGTWARELNFYMPHTWWMPRAGAPVSEVDVLRWLPVRTWPVRPTAMPPVRGFRLVSAERVAGFSIERYRGPAPVRLYPSPPYDDASQLRRPAPEGWHHHHLLLVPAAP